VLRARPLLSGWSFSIRSQHSSYYKSKEKCDSSSQLNSEPAASAERMRLGFWRRWARYESIQNQVVEASFMGCQKSEQRTQGARPGSLCVVGWLVSLQFQSRTLWAWPNLLSRYQSRSRRYRTPIFCQLLASCSLRGSLVDWPAVLPSLVCPLFLSLCQMRYLLPQL